MNRTKSKPKKNEFEEIRCDYLDRLEEIDLAEFTPGSFGCHELLDRTSLIVNQIEEWLLAHPACVQNPEWFQQAAHAQQLLQDLYQKIGAAQLNPAVSSPKT